MKNIIRMTLILVCMVMSISMVVQADGNALQPTLKIDGYDIDISNFINIEDKHITIKGLNKLTLIGIKTQIEPVERRIIVSYGKIKISAQILGANITKVKDTYVIDVNPRFKVITEMKAGSIGIKNNNLNIELFSNGAEKQPTYYIYDLMVDKTGINIIGIKPVTFKSEPAKYLGIYSPKSPLDPKFVPKDLAYLSKSIKATLAKSGLQLNKDAAYNLMLMLDQAKKEGIQGYKITSTYRSFAYQWLLFKNKVTSLSRKMTTRKIEDEAATVVARPGTSEHQSGLAVDITVNGMDLIEKFGSTKQGQWIEQNSWKYGYVVRYYEDKSHLTGIIWEPWHLRFLGVPHAKALYDYKICLEEYIQNLDTFGHYSIEDRNSIQVVVKDRTNNVILESLPVQFN